MPWFFGFLSPASAGHPHPTARMCHPALWQGWVLGKGSFPTGCRAVLKRDISPCNSITQNKKPKLEHSAINAGSIDSCAAPSWLINPRCSYKPIPAAASPQQEPNERTWKAEIPPCPDLLSARGFKHHTLPKTTSVPGAVLGNASPGL